jgi:predicted RNA-binding Zn ribbon-like protein
VEQEPVGRDYHLVGGLLCLDLVNTEAMHRGERVDLLETFSDLVAWLRDAGALTRAAARAAWERWRGTTQSDAALREARRLRAALREMAERMAGGRAPGEEALRAVNEALAKRPGYPQVVRDGKGYATLFQPVDDSALHLLAPVAESAAWLLAEGDPALVRRCENDRCVLVFYDTTKNKRRRWCSMQACGSRAKSAAYYRRTRGAP